MKILGKIFSIIRGILFVVIIIILAVILTQRISDNKMAVAGLRLFTVVTESMVPEYLVGDTLLVMSIDPSEIKEGDDITYMGEVDSFKDKIVTHRVLKNTKNSDGTYTLKTKGIANEIEDPEIKDSQVFGKVLYKVKSISFLNGIVGDLNYMYFLIVVPMALMVFFEYRGYKKEKNAEENGTEDDEDKISNTDRHKERRKQRKLRRKKRKTKDKES